MVSHSQGRFECLSCGKSGRLQNFSILSVCSKCNSYMILPLADFDVLEGGKVAVEAEDTDKQNLFTRETNNGGDIA
jgi:hypothetical protein